MAGEVFEFHAEVGLVEVARGLGEPRPVDRMLGIDRQDQSREAVAPRTRFGVSPTCALN